MQKKSGSLASQPGEAAACAQAGALWRTRSQSHKRERRVDRRVHGTFGHKLKKGDIHARDKVHAALCNSGDTAVPCNETTLEFSMVAI